MAKVKLVKRLPFPLSTRIDVGDVVEVKAQWGAAVEVESPKGFSVRLMPDEYEWVADGA